MDQPAGADVRCSAVVFRGQDVLLVRRLHDGEDDWVLPGGTPRPGESMVAWARRETLEETGLAVEPSRIAFVLETQGPRSGRHTVHLVFLAPPPAPGQEPRSLEPDLSATFVPLTSCTNSICDRRWPGTCVGCMPAARLVPRPTWAICGARATAMTCCRCCSSSPTSPPGHFVNVGVIAVRRGG